MGCALRKRYPNAEGSHHPQVKTRFCGEPWVFDFNGDIRSQIQATYPDAIVGYNQHTKKTMYQTPPKSYIAAYSQAAAFGTVLRAV